MENLIQTATKFAPQLLVLAFLLITFLTSGIDKITDWKGNIAYFNDHFGNTFLKGKSSLMLGALTLMEIIASVLAFVGIAQIYLNGSTEIG
ncbi:MAG TPA: DoxX family protein, partial [Flavobacteriaceae bacterium]|nr:DoxX family protein [Flavobacteriaceae bacterium]